MATATPLPNGDGTGAGDWTIFGGPASRYLAINNGVDTPDDTDYIRNTVFQGDPDENIFLLFEDMPGDFDVITAVDLRIRERAASTISACGVRYQLFKADETTALTNQLVRSGTGDFNAAFTDRTYTFTITGDTDVTSWNGVRLELDHFDADGDDTDYDVAEIELSITYTATGGGGGDTGSPIHVKANAMMMPSLQG